MENFESMADVDLSLYDDASQYEQEEEENVRVNKRTESVFTEDDTITISRFVNSYLGINMDCSNLYHEGLKELLGAYEINDRITPADFLFPLPNRIADNNPQLVYDGYVLVVIDNKKNGCRKDYLSPTILKEILRKPEVEEHRKELTRNGVKDFNHLGEYINEFYAVSQELTTIELYEQIVDLAKRHTKMNDLKEKYEGVKKL
jgi:hypothetical protein